MSERDGYQHGVPCWIDIWQDDAEAGAAFYTQLFGWEAENTLPPDSPTSHVMCRLRGRDAAAIGSPMPEAAGAAPAWTTHVWVDDPDATAAKAREAGGSVLVEPFPQPRRRPYGDPRRPGRRRVRRWLPGADRGAEVVNEPGARGP